MSFGQKLTTPLRRGSTSLPTAPVVPGATLARSPPRPFLATSGQTSSVHTSAPAAAPAATPIAASSQATPSGSAEPGAAGSGSGPLLWKASSPAVETWWGTRPCPVALGTPTGVMFDGPARARGDRPRMRWDLEGDLAT